MILRDYASRLAWISFVRREIRLIVALTVAGGGFWGFVDIAAHIVSEAAEPFDRAVLLALRAPGDLANPIGPPWLEIAARDFTSLGSFATLTFITLALVGYFAVARRWADAVFVATATAGGFALSTVLKFEFARPRPDLVPHAVDIYTASFPSSHAMLSAITYLTLGTMLAQAMRTTAQRAYIFAVTALLTVLVGATRVYLGVHWPTDVLAGWCIGLAWATTAWLAAHGRSLYRGPPAQAPAGDIGQP